MKILSRAIFLAVALAVAACGSPAESHPAQHPAIHVSSPAAATGSTGLSIGDACGEFHTASTQMSAAGVSNLDAMRQYGQQLVKESAELMKESPDPGPSLAHDLGLAGTANLAVAIGFLPKGLAKGLEVAANAVNQVGTDCREAGY
jgi:hypothetical protein